MVASDVVSRPGGRSSRVRAAVLDATLSLIDQRRTQLTVTDIAEAAGVAPSSIYRRWGTWESVVAEAVLDYAETTVPVPDTGALRDDLIEFASVSAAFLRTSRGSGLLRAVAAIDAPGAFATARDKFWDERFSLAEEMFHRAAERGEIAEDVDSKLLLEMLIAPLHFRQLLLGKDPAEQIHAQVDVLLAGVRRNA